MYRLKIHQKAKKALDKIHPNDRRRIIKALINLAKNPFSRTLNIKKLVGTKSSFRLRTGDLRAIYEIDKKKKEIYVWEIGYRGGIY